MKETEQLRTLMESVYTPVTEDDTDGHGRHLQAELAKTIAEIKVYYTAYNNDNYNEEYVMEMLDELYKGALGDVFGGEF